MTEKEQQRRERTPEEVKAFKEKIQKRKEKNLNLVTNHIDTVCIIPADKPAFARYALVQMILVADRMISTLKRQVGFAIPFETARELLGSLDRFTDEIWNYAVKTSPHLYSFDKRRWRELNDPVDIKQKLVNGRNFVSVILPRSEETGQLAIAVKILENHILHVRSTGPFDKIEEAIGVYRNIIEKLDRFLADLAEKTGAEYDSPAKRLAKNTGETNSEQAATTNTDSDDEKAERKKRRA